MTSTVIPWPAMRPGQSRPVIESVFLPECREGLRRLLGLATATVVEVGSYRGESAAFIAEAAPNAHVFAVDAWDTTRRFDGVPMADVEDFLATLWTHRERVTAVRGWSPGALGELADAGVDPDLVYLDGDHSREGVERDLSAVLRLWPDATVCGDDYAPEFPGVAAAVDALVGDRVVTSGRFWRVIA